MSYYGFPSDYYPRGYNRQCNCDHSRKKYDTLQRLDFNSTSPYTGLSMNNKYNSYEQSVGRINRNDDNTYLGYIKLPNVSMYYTRPKPTSTNKYREGYLSYEDYDNAYRDHYKKLYYSHNIKYSYEDVMKELKDKTKRYEPENENETKRIKPEDLEPLTDLDKNRIKMLSCINRGILQVNDRKFWVFLTNTSSNFHFLAKNSLINKYSLVGKNIHHRFLNDTSKEYLINHIKYLTDTFNIIILIIKKKDKYLDKSPSQIIEDVLDDDKSFAKIKDNISPFKIVLNH